MALGVLLIGRGHVGVSDLRLESVGDDVATTTLTDLDLPERPVNLDFSEPVDLAA